jgi:hypothetical protein
MRITMITLLTVAACDTETPEPGPNGSEPDGPGMGGQFGQEDEPWCVEASAAPLAVDETSSLGFAPQGVLDLVLGDHAPTLTWADGGSTGLSLPVDDRGEAWEITYENTSEYDIGCASSVGIAVTVGFVTEDGRFDEGWDLRLEAWEEGSVAHRITLDSIAGTFTLADHVDISEYEETWVDLHLQFDDAGATGLIEAIGQRTEPATGSADGSVSATTLPVATFE